jgi:hypothetical protein
VRFLLLLACLSGCVETVDLTTQRAHRDCVTRVRLEGLSVATLEAASDVWEPLGVEFIARGEHYDLTARLGDVAVAGTNGEWSPASAIATIEADDPLLLAHELGHALGLDHVGGCSVMSPSACSIVLSEEDFAEWERTAR